MCLARPEKSPRVFAVEKLRKRFNFLWDTPAVDGEAKIAIVARLARAWAIGGATPSGREDGGKRKGTWSVNRSCSGDAENWWSKIANC